jgi:4-hydroxy-2-oxoheptanedioate aldolase
LNGIDGLQGKRMKSSALHRFRLKLEGNEPLYGLMVTLEAAAIADIAAGFGFDWIVIDAANGHLDWQQVLEHIRATARSETVALVRLAEGKHKLIERALQIGADGVLIPVPEKASQLQLLVNLSSRPNYQQVTVVDRDSANLTWNSNTNSLIVPVIDAIHETEKLRELISVDGVELFFLECSIRDETQAGAAMDRLLYEIRNHGKHAGILAARNDDLLRYVARQFRFLGVGSDAGIILRGIQDTMDAVNKLRA